MIEIGIPALNLRRHLRNAFSVGLGRILAQGLNLIVFPLVLQFISPADFGVYSLLQMVSLIYGVGIALGLSTVFMARFLEAETQTGGVASLLGACLSQQFVFGGLLFLVGVAIAQPLTRGLVGPALTNVLIVLLGSEFLANHVLIVTRWQVLTFRHAQVSLVALVRASVYLASALWLVGARGWGILGLAAADLLSDFLALAVSLWLARGNLRWGFSFSDLRATLRLGLPATPDTIFFWLIVSMPLYFLRRSGNPDAAGAFGLAWRMMSVIDLLGNSLASGAARALLENTRLAFPLNLRRIFRASLSLLAGTVLMLSLFGPEALRWWFPQEFYAAGALLPFVALGYFFLGLYYFEWVGLSGSQRTGGLSLASGAGMVAGLVVFLWVGFNTSPLIASGAFAVSFLVMWLVARAVRPGVKFGQWWELLALGLVLLVLTEGLNAVPLDPVLRALLKVFVLALGGAACLIIEGLVRLQEARETYRFHDIPTYAEVASLIADGQRVLDVGCSEGFFLSEVSAPMRVGVERNWQLARRGKVTYPEVQFVCADAEALPFASGAFDRVTLIGVLPYVHDPAHVIVEAARSLSPEGCLALSAAANYPIYRWISLNHFSIQVRYFQLTELVGFLRKAGLQVTCALERGRLLAPVLSTFYKLPGFIDHRVLRAASVLGPLGRWVRQLTNPLIRWEFRSFGAPGYQLFVAGKKT